MSDVQSHLYSKEFSAGLRVKLSSLGIPHSRPFGLTRGGRNTALIDLLGKEGKVLHFGCADHAPLIQTKLENGVYFHQLLKEAVGESNLWGYDPNLEGVAEMRRLGFGQVVESLEALREESFDTILFPDTLEHLQNPGLVLDEIKQLEFRTLIVSVPNAYSLSNRFFFGSEVINSDHRTLHSAYSLSKLLAEAGFVLTSLTFADFWGWSKPLTSFMKLSFPMTREHLIAVFEKAR